MKNAGNIIVFIPTCHPGVDVHGDGFQGHQLECLTEPLDVSQTNSVFDEKSKQGLLLGIRVVGEMCQRLLVFGIDGQALELPHPGRGQEKLRFK